jgi:hypothetical protein
VSGRGKKKEEEEEEGGGFCEAAFGVFEFQMLVLDAIFHLATGIHVYVFEYMT